MESKPCEGFQDCVNDNCVTLRLRTSRVMLSGVRRSGRRRSTNTACAPLRVTQLPCPNCPQNRKQPLIKSKTKSNTNNRHLPLQHILFRQPPPHPRCDNCDVIPITKSQCNFFRTCFCAAAKWREKCREDDDPRLHSSDIIAIVVDEP